MARREYPVHLIVNNRPIRKVVIDDHYEANHRESITDQIILELVHQLSGGLFSPESESEGFQYFVSDNLVLDKKYYKLIWLLENSALYIGVVNAYRRTSAKQRRT